MKFARLERAELAIAIFADRSEQFLVQARSGESCQRQVRDESAPFFLDVFLCERAIDITGERRESCRGVQARPENVWALLIRKKSQTLKSKIERGIGVNRRKRGTDSVELCIRHFADEFESHVKILRGHPAHVLLRELIG